MPTLTRPRGANGRFAPKLPLDTDALASDVQSFAPVPAPEPEPLRGSTVRLWNLAPIRALIHDELSVLRIPSFLCASGTPGTPSFHGGVGEFDFATTRKYLKTLSAMCTNGAYRYVRNCETNGRHADLGYRDDLIGMGRMLHRLVEDGLSAKALAVAGATLRRVSLAQSFSELEAYARDCERRYPTVLDSPLGKPFQNAKGVVITPPSPRESLSLFDA